MPEQILKIRNENIAVFDSRELKEYAVYLANQFGCSPLGFSLLRENLLARIDIGKRESIDADPNLTRVAIQLYNLALTATGIDDELQLNYHFTNQQGRDGIVSDSAIKVFGVSGIEQTKEAIKLFFDGKIAEGFTRFMKADNWERVAIHASRVLQPETVRGSQTNLFTALINGFRAYFRQSRSIGVPDENLEYYFEIISPRSIKLFRRTLQGRMGIIDEVFTNEKSLSLRERERYLILGPKINPVYSKRV